MKFCLRIVTFVSKAFSPCVHQPAPFFNRHTCVKKEKQKGEERQIWDRIPIKRLCQRFLAFVS